MTRILTVQLRQVYSAFPYRDDSLLFLALNGGLRGAQAGDGHPEGAAGDVVQADFVAEFDGGGIAAVLAADAAMQLRIGALAQLHGHFHQLANAHGVQTGEGIGFIDLVGIIGGQELAGVVAGEAEGHLGQVVGAEAEEVGFLGDFVCGQGGAGDFDHGAHFVGQLHAGFRDEGVRSLDHDVLHELVFLHFANQGDHDFRNDLPIGMTALHSQRGLDDGAGLHSGDFGISDGQAAAAMAHHGVEFMQIGDNLLDVSHGLALGLGQRFDIGLVGGHEFMQRGIQEADGDGMAVQRLEQALEVGLLHGLDLGQRGFALFHRLSADHFAERADAGGVEEHMLGAAQADALRAEGGRLLRVLGGVGVGAHAHGLILIGQLHDPAEIAAVGVGGHGGDQFAVDIAGGAVQGQLVPFVVGLAGQGEALVFFIHLDIAAAGNAAGAHAAGHNGRMAGLAAADGQDALAVLHALDILGAGFQANQNHLFALPAMGDGVLGGEDDMAGGRAGRSGDALAHGLRLLQGGGVEGGMQQHIQGFRVDLHQRFFLGDHALVDQIAGDLDGGGGGALAVTGLEHIQLAVLHGEFHILHIVVMVFQGLAHLHELLERFGEFLLHLGDGHGGAHAGHNVLALRVGEEFAEEALAAGGGRAGEGHAGAAIVAHVAEGHHLHVHGRAPGIGDVMIHAVDIGAGVVPGTENGLDGGEKLFLGIVGEILAQLLLIFGLELVGQLVQVLGGELGVEGHALLFLHGVDELFEILLAHFHNHVGEHLDEAAIAVPRPAGIVGLGGDNVHHVLIQAQVQDGIHHAGHGSARAGAHGNQQRVLMIAELFARDLFHLADVFHDLGLDFVVNLPAVLVILGAGFGGDGEALGNGKADVGHFRQVGALAAQQLAHAGVALGKQVHILLCHERYSFRNWIGRLREHKNGRIRPFPCSTS